MPLFVAYCGGGNQPPINLKVKSRETCGIHQQTMSPVNNKLVVKNAVALTLRMVLVTVVGLYTTRIVLQALGVDDYGIYGVIGGVVGIAGFLNTSMAGATSRFITFELGRGNDGELSKIFSTALIIHIIIAVFVAVLAETVGLWFVNSRMNFPPGRMFAVNVLYQFTIVSMLFSFTQVPYSAAIMAYEKMNVYAYFEIINAVLKLVIVYLLMIVDTDKLIFYAAMMLGVSVFSTFLARFYCIRHFQETRFRFIWDKTILRNMLTFFGFGVYGNMCLVVQTQSLPIILNLFFGVIANVGASIATTITGALGGLTVSIAQAFQPQIIKLYAANALKDMAKMMRRSVQFTLLAYAMIGLPVFLEAESILQLWLGQVPTYSVEFLRLIIITAFFNIVVNTNSLAVQATGNIRRISFYSGTLNLLCPVASYLILRYWIKDAATVYAVNIVCAAIIVLLGWLFVKLQISELRLRTYVVPVLRSWLAIALSCGVIVLINAHMPATDCDDVISCFSNILLKALICAVVLVSVTIVIALSRGEVSYLWTVVSRKLRINRNHGL